MSTSNLSWVAAEHHNHSQRINQLPAEILSQIFMAGHNMDLETDLPEAQLVKYEEIEEGVLYFEEKVAQTCRYWRKIALGLPKLWSHIGIEGLPPHYRAELFLARAGPITLLDLEVDIRIHSLGSLVSTDMEEHVQRATEALQYIIDHGGSTSRWKSLQVWGSLSCVALGVLDFLSGAMLNNLTFLELVADCYNMNYVDDFDETLEDLDLLQAVMFREPPPRLRRLNLDGFPTAFFFANPSVSLVSGLTYLQLNTVPMLPPLQGMYNLLTCNPLLEYLSLNMGSVDQVFANSDSVEDRVADLPHLRHLNVVAPTSSYWLLSVLMMMDAPRVESLALDLRHLPHFPPPGIIILYMSKGRKNGEIATQPLGNDGIRGPVYPALQHLSIGPFPDQGHYLGTMLHSCSKLTRLDWELGESCDKAILGLADYPLPCPQLQHLRTRGVPNDELLDVVRSRVKRGAPLKIVEVNIRDWDRIKGSTKRYLKGAVERFGQYVDRDWEGGWDDNETDTESPTEL